MQTRQSVLMTTLALVVLLAAACSAALGASTLPSGSYANDKTGYGPLVLTLADGGQFTLTAGGEKVLTQGTWKVTGDQIELTENSKGFCPNRPGTYKWALDGKALTFTMVQQSCVLSVPFDSQAAWVRQP